MADCIKEYCVGCGLCASIEGIDLKVDNKGFSYPVNTNAPFLKSVCPAGGKNSVVMDKKDIWGKNLNVLMGWTNNENLRTKASSGGVLTELAAYALEHGFVDEVMHTMVDDSEPTKTITTFSSSREELEAKCGSRYSISHPLDKIGELNKSKKYLFIGKPCDVVVLRNYLEINPKMKEVIPYMFSFFCAGLPSVDAQERLLEKMGTSLEDCRALKYRGDGWPGVATAIAKNGTIYRMEYREAWGRTLGRDIMKACRVCLDGIGEMADVSCGDAWHLNDDGTPDFGEHAGRNVVFARTEKGLALLEAAKQDGAIHSEEFPEYDSYLRKIQMYQFERKATMHSKLAVLRMMGKTVPMYDSKALRGFSKAISGKKKMRIVVGTFKRVLKGKF